MKLLLSRATFRGALLAGFLALAPSATTAAAPVAGLPDTRKMNVLFIIIEDCYAGVWGAYGNTICRTPNLDRFTTTAVRFDRAYVQAIARDPAHASTRADMAALLQAGWKAARPASAR